MVPGDEAKKEEPAIEWDRETPATWVDAVNGWKWQWIGDNAWEKAGLCPRCGDGMTLEKAGAWTRSARRG